MRELKKWIWRLKVLLLYQLRSPLFYLTTALLAGLQLFLGCVSLPAASNRVVGLVDGGGYYSKAVTQALCSSDSEYTWRMYPDRDALSNAVMSGEADSGFVFDERLDAAVSKVEEAVYENGSSGILTPDLKGLVDYYVSSSSTKGAAAKESVYACLLEQISPIILKSAVRSGTLFADSGEDVCQKVLEELQHVMDEDMMLHIRFETYGEEGNAAVEEPAKTKDGDLALIASLLLFAAALLFATAKFREGSAALCIWLRKGGWFFRVLEIFAPLLIAGIILVAVLCFEGLTVSLYALLLIPALFATALWTSLFARLFRREGMYLFLSVALLLIAGVLTSSAGDLFFLNSVRWAKVFFPSFWLKECLIL